MKINKRYIGAAMIAPFIAFIFLGGIYLKLFTIVLSIGGIYEFYKTVKVKGFNPISVAGYLLLVVYYLINNDLELMMIALVLASILLLCIPVLNTKINFIDISLTIFGFIYVGIFLSFIYLVNAKVHGNYLVWLIFLSSWLCDTTAYYIGKYFGKTKICPLVSPNKTLAGSVGGLFGSAIALTIYGVVIADKVPSMALYHYTILGIICGVFCQFGDLIASSIKRFVGIKDYSNLIPGHGGILDRFDSIIFAAAIVYMYLTYVVVI